MKLHTKYPGSKSCDFRQDDFFMFSFRKSIFSDLAIQWTGTIGTIIEESHIMIIPTKFGQNQASRFSNVAIVEDARNTTSNDHNSSQVSYKETKVLIDHEKHNSLS